MIVLKSSLVAERSTKGKGVVNKEDALAFLTSKTALGFSLPPPPFRLFAVLAFALTLGVASAGPAGNHRNEILRTKCKSNHAQSTSPVGAGLVSAGVAPGAPELPSAAPSATGGGSCRSLQPSHPDRCVPQYK